MVHKFYLAIVSTVLFCWTSAFAGDLNAPKGYHFTIAAQEEFNGKIGVVVSFFRLHCYGAELVCKLQTVRLGQCSKSPLNKESLKLGFEGGVGLFPSVIETSTKDGDLKVKLEKEGLVIIEKNQNIITTIHAGFDKNRHLVSFTGGYEQTPYDKSLKVEKNKYLPFSSQNQKINCIVGTDGLLQ